MKKSYNRKLIIKQTYARYKISFKIKNSLLKNSLRIFFPFEIFGRRLSLGKSIPKKCQQGANNMPKLA